MRRGSNLVEGGNGGSFGVGGMARSTRIDRERKGILRRIREVEQKELVMEEEDQNRSVPTARGSILDRIRPNDNITKTGHSVRTLREEEEGEHAQPDPLNLHCRPSRLLPLLLHHPRVQPLLLPLHRSLHCPSTIRPPPHRLSLKRITRGREQRVSQSCWIWKLRVGRMGTAIRIRESEAKNWKLLDHRR